MTTTKRSPRTPALFATSTLTLAAAALGVVLTTTGGAATGAAPTTSATTTAAPTSGRAPVDAVPGARAADPRSGDPAGQQYLDDPADRLGELLHRYNSCLLDHGATEDTGAAVAVSQGDHPAVTIAQPVPAAAATACADLEPRGPRELDPRTNPEYGADADANVACLRDHGVMVHRVTAADDVPSGLLWTYDSATGSTPADQARIERDCLVASFGS